MLMSQDQFERIVGSHGHDATKSAVLPVGCRRAPERRGAVRVSFGKRTRICCDSGATAGEWITVVVQDVSQSGVGLLCADKLGPGETFVVKLPQRDGRIVRVRCAARRCEPGGFGGVAFLVGATFEQVIEEPSIRLNEDDGHPAEWNQLNEAPAGSTTGTKPIAVNDKVARGGFMRAAVSMLKAVTPARWIGRNDDFNSN